MRQVFVTDNVWHALRHDLPKKESDRLSRIIDRLEIDPYADSVEVATEHPGGRLHIIPSGSNRLVYDIDSDNGNVYVVGIYSRPNGR